MFCIHPYLVQSCESCQLNGRLARYAPLTSICKREGESFWDKKSVKIRSNINAEYRTSCRTWTHGIRVRNVESNRVLFAPRLSLISVMIHSNFFQSSFHVKLIFKVDLDGNVWPGRLRSLEHESFKWCEIHIQAVKNSTYSSPHYHGSLSFHSQAHGSFLGSHSLLYVFPAQHSRPDPSSLARQNSSHFHLIAQVISINLKSLGMFLNHVRSR